MQDFFHQQYVLGITLSQNPSHHWENHLSFDRWLLRIWVFGCWEGRHPKAYIFEHIYISFVCNKYIYIFTKKQVHLNQTHHQQVYNVPVPGSRYKWKIHQLFWWFHPYLDGGHTSLLVPYPVEQAPVVLGLKNGDMMDKSVDDIQYSYIHSINIQ